MSDTSGFAELQRKFDMLPAKMQRSLVRKGVRAAARPLINNIRKNIKSMVSDEAASRGGRKRVNAQGKKTSLAKSIDVKPWSKPEQGIIGGVVGAKWPEGAHAHLVEFGHLVVPTKTQGPIGAGKVRRTRPIPFQRKAEKESRVDILRAWEDKIQVEIKKAGI